MTVDTVQALYGDNIRTTRSALVNNTEDSVVIDTIFIVYKDGKKELGEWPYPVGLIVDSKAYGFTKRGMDSCGDKMFFDPNISLTIPKKDSLWIGHVAATLDYLLPTDIEGGPDVFAWFIFKSGDYADTLTVLGKLRYKTQSILPKTPKSIIHKSSFGSPLYDISGRKKAGRAVGVSVGRGIKNINIYKK